jgi:carnitine 3-dehydrogenase
VVWQDALSLIRDGLATTEDPVSLIAAQSEAQSGHLSIRDLERQRDHTLVAVIRALKQQASAVGRVILDHEAVLRRPPENEVPLVTVRRVVPVDWTDINGHMNESRYGQVFSDASEEVMTHIGADSDYIAAGHSYFTVESTIKYLAETHAGEDIYVTTRVVAGQGKKLKLWHQMHRRSDDRLLATCDQSLLHVSLDTRRSCPPLPHVSAALERLATAHSGARS